MPRNEVAREGAHERATPAFLGFHEGSWAQVADSGFVPLKNLEPLITLI